MNYYDFEKAKEIILEEHKTNGAVSADMGMRNDWFWTAETVWKAENPDDWHECFEKGFLAGLAGSQIDWPCLRIEYEGDFLKEFDVTKTNITEKEKEEIDKRAKENHEETIKEMTEALAKLRYKDKGMKE